jgi:excisionase family DNA binding protein
MPQQYYTLEQAAQILHIGPEQLKEMARKKEIRAFQDRSGWRFRSQEIDEMARERGYGSDPELPLGEAAKKPGDSGGNDVFNFSLDPGESSEVPLGKEPAPSRSGSRKTGSSKSPPKASSDSDVRLVLDGNDIDPGSSKASSSRAPVSPAPKVGSSKSRIAPVKDDSGVRIVPLDQPSDSDVKITPSQSDSDVAKKTGKRASDSDIRIEEVPRSGRADQNVTEEIDLDAEQRRADAARAKATRHRPKPGSSPVLPTTSPFELSENDLDMDGPTIPPASRSPRQADADTDSSSDFELKPMGDSSPLELSDDEVSLGELTGGKNASGINLQDPADSGISLEQEGSDEMQLDLNLDAGGTPQPAPAQSETDSSSDFELSLQDEDASSPAEGSSSEFELSLQDDDAAVEGSSSEFELSLDAEGSSDLALETPGSDSDSEFELTLDEGGGLSVEDSGQNVVETEDFEVPSFDEESGSEAVALDEGDTDLESSEFDLSLEGEESGSQVVPLEDEEDVDEGAATVQRRAAPAADDEDIEDIGEDLDADLDAEPAAEEEEAVAVSAAAPPAEWGVLPALVMLPCTILLFVVALMSFELIQGMWGYHRGTKVSNLIIHPIAKMFDDTLPDN